MNALSEEVFRTIGQTVSTKEKFLWENFSSIYKFPLWKTFPMPP